MPPTVEIHYRRLPDDTTTFRQILLEEAALCTVTLLPEAAVREPIVLAGATILEPGAPIVWFTFPERWYDVGRFHRKDGTFTGYYANVLTPVRMEEEGWYTTDLFLDVWKGADGVVRLLDEDELDGAERRSEIDAHLATKAREVATELLVEAGTWRWPPEPVDRWPLAVAVERWRLLAGG